MKKLILIFVILVCMLSCKEYTRYPMTADVTYDIVYPDTTIRYTDNFNFYIGGEDNPNNVKIHTYSSRGTNYLGPENCYHYFVSNTCPIRVVDYKVNKQ